MPRTTTEVALSALSDPLPQRDELQTVSLLLGKLHEETRWPIELIRPSGDETADTTVLQHSYILFVWNGEASSLNETLENQLQNLKDSTTWNPRGRFLVVVTDRNNISAHLLAVHICSIMWQWARIVNVVVLIKNQFPYLPLNTRSTKKTREADRLNLYTWFPYKFGRYGEAQDVILLDEWVFENNGRFSLNVHLYPAKVPKDFMGLPIILGWLSNDISMKITENSTENDYRIARKAKYLCVEIVQLVCEKMNLTTIYRAPSTEFSIDSYSKEFGDLDDGLSDVLTGLIPLIPFVAISSFDVTIPYDVVSAKMFVPCPKPIPGPEKVLSTFSLSVWLTISLVLLLTTAAFWCASNGPYRSVCNETHTYQSLSICFHNAWAILVAVSVPQQPTTASLRVFFLLYVCFCFAISTVFQAFFVSYLVEPKYEKKLETFDDIVDSDVVYFYLPMSILAKGSIPYPEYDRFIENKKLQEECSDTYKCILRMITKRDICIIHTTSNVNYVARELGTEGVGKIVCSFDEAVGSAGVSLLFKKGNPLLERFNILMRRYLEAGFPERIRNEEKHRTSLKGGWKYVPSPGDDYFAFSISHLIPAFMLLIVGSVFSSVLFIAELIVNWLYKRKTKI